MQLHHRHPSQIPPVWELPARPQRENPMLFARFYSEMRIQTDERNRKQQRNMRRIEQVNILQ